MRWLWVSAGVAAAVLGWADVVHWRASRRRLGTYRETVTREVVVVLGCADRGTRANAINRYRVRAALRSIDPQVADSTLVFSGGAVAGDVSEAALMHAYARDERGHRGTTVLEEESRTTWENVQRVTPLLEGADRVVLVSGSLHAEKARAHLWQQRPDLADRLARGQEHRWGEVLWLKPPTAVRGLRKLRRLRAQWNS